MREGPILELALEVALMASRGQPYLMALEQGVSPIFGIDTGVGLVTWKRSEGSGTVQGDLSVVGGRRSWTTQQIAEVAGTAPQHPNYQGLWQTAFPVRTSDHITLREFWPTDVWRNHHGHCDGRYPIGFAVSCSTTELKFVAMHRSDHDFSDEEVSALAAIQALLTSALEFRSRLDLAVDRLSTHRSSTVRPRATAPPVARRKSSRSSHSAGPTTASEDTWESANEPCASTLERSTPTPAFPAGPPPPSGGRLRTAPALAQPRTLRMRPFCGGQGWK